ncbi:unnamed protein product, partial [Phaeothamnion confervicola]
MAGNATAMRQSCLAAPSTTSMQMNCGMTVTATVPEPEQEESRDEPSQVVRAEDAEKKPRACRFPSVAWVANAGTIASSTAPGALMRQPRPGSFVSEPATKQSAG